MDRLQTDFAKDGVISNIELCNICSSLSWNNKKANYICGTCNQKFCETCLCKHITESPMQEHTIKDIEKSNTDDFDGGSKSDKSLNVDRVSLTFDSNLDAGKDLDIYNIVSDLNIEAVGETENDTNESENILQRSKSLLSIDSSIYSSGPYPDTLCTGCLRDKDQPNEAVLYCVECRANLCFKCIRKHNGNKWLRLHTLKDMAGFTLPKPEDWEDSLSDGRQYLKYDCSFCAWGGRVEDAIRRCIDCEANYCFTCLRWHHKCEHNQNHVLYYLPGMGIGKGTELCPVHQEEIVDKFCIDHDVVGCNLCMHLEHKECENIKDVDSVAKDIQNSQELVDAKQMVNETKQTLLKLLHGRKDDMDRINVEKEDVLDQLHENKERIIKHLEVLESKIIDRLDTKYKAFENNINEDITELETMMSKLERHATQLQTFNGENESQLFVNVKQAQMRKEDSDILTQKVDNSIGRETIHFVLYTDLAETVCAKQLLGEFVFDSAIPFDQFNIQTETDTSTCRVNGLCRLSDGTTVIVDNENTKIKHLDNAYNVMSEYKLPYAPVDVCMVGPNEVAIAIPFENSIQFATINHEIILKQSFTVSTICRSVAWNENELFVLCGQNPGQIQVYDMHGALLRSYIIARTANILKQSHCHFILVYALMETIFTFVI